MPASAPPSANVKAIVRSTSIPSMRAASRSCAVARIALPARVFCTRYVIASSVGIVISSTISAFCR